MSLCVSPCVPACPCVSLCVPACPHVSLLTVTSPNPHTQTLPLSLPEHFPSLNSGAAFLRHSLSRFPAGWAESQPLRAMQEHPWRSLAPSQHLPIRNGGNICNYRSQSSEDVLQSQRLGAAPWSWVLSAQELLHPSAASLCINNSVSEPSHGSNAPWHLPSSSCHSPHGILLG